LTPEFARNVVTGFARVDGRPVGVVANNPRVMAGTVDADVATAAARFVSLYDAFGLPVRLLEDIPGILPGPDSGADGVARAAGKLPYELNRATVPIVNVILRRGYGFGHVAMGGGESARNVLTAVWPTAEDAAMGVEGAVDVVHGDDIERADDPEARRRELIGIIVANRMFRESNLHLFPDLGLKTMNFYDNPSDRALSGPNRRRPGRRGRRGGRRDSARGDLRLDRAGARTLRRTPRGVAPEEARHQSLVKSTGGEGAGILNPGDTRG
jgi:hypothetical protein